MNKNTEKQVKDIIESNQENLYEKYKDKQLPLSPQVEVDKCVENFKSLKNKIINIDSCGNGRWNTYLIKIKGNIYEVGINGLPDEQDIYYIKDLNNDLNVPESPKIMIKKKIN